MSFGLAGRARMAAFNGGNDAFTKLLLHCDGVDAATSFPDVSASAHTVTANGNAQVDTAQSKFGGASLIVDGTGDYLSVPDHADWDFGTGDFTVDFWFRRNGTQGAFSNMVSSFNGASGWHIAFGSSG